jgi:uncharacterized membrane protein YdjX (TVP38/TMEM64 family)
MHNLKSNIGGSRFGRLLLLLFVFGLTIALVLMRDQIRRLGTYGYPGIFLFSILANATVIIPLPGVIITSAMGAIFNPFWVAIAAGSGSAIGELTGYLAGYSGQKIVERVPWYDTIEKWVKKYGGFTILILAIIPNPAFDMAGIAAGALKLPIRRFLFWCVLGKIIKMSFFAYGGAALINGFLPIK